MCVTASYYSDAHIHSLSPSAAGPRFTFHALVTLIRDSRNITPTRRFPPPWSIEERQESFIVKDAPGQPLAYLYYENEPHRQLSTKRGYRATRREAAELGQLGRLSLYFSPLPIDEARPAWQC